MRNYIILNGVNSNTITGLLISTLPPITKPKIRTQVEEIDGRDGDIVTKLGYSAYEKEFQIGLYGDFDIDEVIAYFNSEGTVVFSNEEDKYYNYQILDQIDYEKLIRFKTATVKMHVQPFKYPTEEEQIQVDATVVTGSGSNITLEYTNAGNTITSEVDGDTQQDGTPTPDSPVLVQTVTGSQSINIIGKNLFNINVPNVIKNSVTISVSDYTLTQTNTGTYCRSAWKINNLTVGENYTLSYSFINSDGSSIQPRITDSTNTNTIVTGTTTTATSGNATLTFTATETTHYIRLYSNTTSTSNTKIVIYNNIQLEKGAEVTDYSIYQNQIYEINLGKNLSKLIDGTYTSNGITAVVENEQVTLNNTASSTSIIQTFTDTLYLEAGTYTLSSNNEVTANGVIRLSDVDGTTVSSSSCAFSTKNNSITFDITTAGFYKYQIRTGSGGSYNNFVIKPQLEKGNTATSYAPYKTPIEICKIGDYQDRIYQNEGTWYIEKQINKFVFNGSENWNVTSGIFRTQAITNYLRVQEITSVCNYFESITNGGASGITEGKCRFRSISTDESLYFYISTSVSSTAEDFQTWLSTHNTIVYYVLATPTTTEITDADLIVQLNALAGATTYDSQTNIVVASGDLPASLSVSTQGMPNTVINNIGNIYAKPLITVYGSGDIGVYLNQIQVLQIALGDSGSITIDVSKMEAYDKNTQALMNRLVTGDYMKFLINSGENNIAFSGNVLGFTMDNYTRWV